MKKLIWQVIVLLIWSQYVNAQSMEIKLPSVLPASPEASAINKNGQLTVGLFTGGAQASIPIHEIKLNNLSLPISIDYASNGTKVDEIPSRVGMGWSLNAGGVVSRIVHGAPDDQTTRQSIPAQPENVSSSANLTFYERINQDPDGDPPIYDAEPDEFRYNAPGLSGKFVIDNNGNPVEIPYSANKITVTKTGSHYSKVTIKSLDGVVYEFGDGAVESTSSHVYVSGLHGWQTIKTAFFLKKITFPSKEYVEFNYTAISITSATSASQSINRSDGGDNLCQGNPPNCAVNTYSSLTTSVALVNYDSYYLSSISGSDGSIINFYYSSRPDYSGDNRLTSISINTTSTGAKNFVLSYYDPSTNGTGYYPGSTNTNKRFFLKDLTQIATNPQSVVDSLKYIFEYNDIDNLPPRLAYSQDHFGYYNGQNNNYSLPTTGDGYTWGGYNTSNKTPDPTYAKKGMLTRITYPTGGYDEFSYEGNTVPQSIQVQNLSTVTASGPGLGSNSNNIWTASVGSILYNQTVTLQVSASHNMYYWEGIGQSPPSNDATKPVTIEFKNTTTNTVIYTGQRTVNTSINIPVSLVAGNNYQIKITVTGEAYHGRGDLTYDLSSGSAGATTNVTTGGIRVRKINSYDPVSDKLTSKFYHYYYLSDTGKISSGIGSYIMGNGDYKSRFGVKTYCPGSCSGCYNLCWFETLSSNSAVPLYAHSGNIVAYRSVIESDDSLFANGGIEHQYELPEVTTGLTVLNNGIKGLSKDSYTGLGGMEKLTTFFNRSKLVLKSIKNTFKFDSLFVMVNALSSRRNFYHITTTPVSNDDFQQYDAAIYSWISKWIQKDSTITTEYDYSGNSLVSYSVDSFGTKENTLPVRTETIASDGQKVSVYMKYPNHYPSSAPYTDMVNANILTPVIEKTLIKNSQQLIVEKNNYNKWYPGTGNTALIIEPQTVQTTKGAGSAETRIRYHSYDSSGNILEVSKENGSRISYIWDYNKSYPVAEIKNGSITQDSIAYTSFETSSKGNWTYSGATSADNSAPTGSYVYSLGAGSLSRPVNSSKSYIVTYWLKNGSGSAAVSGSALSGFPKTHSAKNGWTLYEHRVGSASTITVSGTGTIDEVRLYPVGAFMTTYSYIPNVGISSSSSANNVLSRYEYDHFNRLLRIRDGDRNILKQNEYAFKQSFTPCSTTTANWSVTGTTRCVQSGANNNYTGVKEREEKDLNNCSPTYLQTRWVTTTPSSPCAQTYCSGEGYRIPTGGNTCTAGQKIFIYQTYLGGGLWECKYYYYWSQDGYRSQDYISTNLSVCEVD